MVGSFGEVWSNETCYIFLSELKAQINFKKLRLTRYVKDKPSVCFFDNKKLWMVAFSAEQSRQIKIKSCKNIRLNGLFCCLMEFIARTSERNFEVNSSIRKRNFLRWFPSSSFDKFWTSFWLHIEDVQIARTFPVFGSSGHWYRGSLQKSGQFTFEMLIARHTCGLDMDRTLIRVLMLNPAKR